MRTILMSKGSRAAVERGPDHPTVYVIAMWVHGLDLAMFHPSTFYEEGEAERYVADLEKRDAAEGREIVYSVRREG